MDGHFLTINLLLSNTHFRKIFNYLFLDYCSTDCIVLGDFYYSDLPF